MLSDEQDRARLRVIRGRQLVTQQRNILSSYQKSGRDTVVAERLLASFEKSLELLEAEMQRLIGQVVLEANKNLF